MKNQNHSARAPYFWVPSLYLAQGLPFFAVMFLANVMLQARGVALDQITHWTAAIGFTWVLKPLWSPFIELASNKKKVVVFFELAGGVALGLVAVALQTPFWFAACIAMLGIVAICSSTHDIACDGLYIASLVEKGQAEYAGWTGTFFNAGRVIAAGGLVSLAGAIAKSSDVVTAWTAIYALLGAMMLALGLYNMWVLPSARNAVSVDTSARAIAASLSEVIAEFFRKPGIWICVLFIILFRAGEAQVQTIGPLFLRASRESGGLGLDLVQLGAVYGSAGTVAFIVGSIGGGYFTARLGLKRAILPLILAVNLPNIVFYLLALYQPTNLIVIGTGLAVEMFGYGFGFVGLILYMMQVVAPGKYQTAHYALATGIMHLGFTLFKFSSGDVQMALGYQHFFLWVLACGVPVAIMSQLISMSARQQNPAPKMAVV
jgi:PAT family beta-lactamase induction signal transducer AmpG